LCIEWFHKLQLSHVCIIWAKTVDVSYVMSMTTWGSAMSKLEYCALWVWSSCVFHAFDSANFLYNFMLSTTSCYACFVPSLWYNYHRCTVIKLHSVTSLCNKQRRVMHCCPYIYDTIITVLCPYIMLVLSQVYDTIITILYWKHLFVQSCFTVWPVYWINNTVLCIVAHTFMLHTTMFYDL
jgi:hypothetical protein